MTYTREDIVRIVQEEDVKFIRMQFVDIFGQLKNVAITAGQLEKALDNRIMIDGSSIEGFVRVNESDQYRRPDLGSFAIYPWRPSHGRVARLLCDVYNPDGTPFIGDPRLVLRKVIARARNRGLTLNVGPECEFFLFQTDGEGLPLVKTNDEAGYFDLGPLDHGEGTRREICMALEQMGFEIEASHHECARGQHEIDFKYADALRTADNIMTFKLAVKTIAKRHGMHATFMPKPKTEANGSGMHIQFSLIKNGENVFECADRPGELSEDAYYFIGGLLAHSKEMALITNPLVNSYKRLVPGYDAPTELTWTENNQNSLVRIPVTRGEGIRVELRSPDASANPYVVLAVCLAAGLDGIKNKITPTKSSNLAAQDQQAEHLPETLKEAIDYFESSSWVKEVLGEEFCRQYVAAKKNEWLRYTRQVTDWEIAEYLYRL